MSASAVRGNQVTKVVVPAIVVVASLAGSILLIARFSIRGIWWLDFGVFRLAGQLPIEAVYNNTPPAPPFIYPPTSLLIFRLLGHLPFNVELALWLLVSLGLLACALRRLDRSSLALMALSAPLTKSILIGQSSILFGGIILLATARHGWIMGALLGLVAAVKPQIVLLAPLVLLVRRDWRAFFAMGLSAASTCLASIAIFGFEPWLGWAAAMPGFQRVLIDGDVLRYLVSPAGTAQFWGVTSLPFHLAGIVVGLAAIGRSASAVQGIELAAIIVTASLLASPYALATDVVPILPFLACSVFRDKLSLAEVAAILIMSMLHVGAGLMLLGTSWSFKFRKTPALHTASTA